jgi:hypothetical protein
MKKGCEAFIAAWDEETTEVLIGRKDDETPIQKLCYEITEACTNVDPSNVPKFDDTIMMDGQPVKMVDNI